jgi:hypothetical protein
MGAIKGRSATFLIIDEVPRGHKHEHHWKHTHGGQVRTCKGCGKVQRRVLEWVDEDATGK